MELQASSGFIRPTKKPRIGKGFYIGKLIEAKPRQKNDGTPIEGKFGKQIILMFAILDKATKAPITYKPQDQPNMTVELVLPMLLNSEYKDRDGSPRPALTPNSRITQAFEALGWKFSPGAKLNVDSFVGKMAEVLIDDYDASMPVIDAEGKPVMIGNVPQVEKYKASCIAKINLIEEPSANAGSPEDAEAGYAKALKELEFAKSNGLLSDQGFSIAQENLKKQYGIN